MAILHNQTEWDRCGGERAPEAWRSWGLGEASAAWTLAAVPALTSVSLGANPPYISLFGVLKKIVMKCSIQQHYVLTTLSNHPQVHLQNFAHLSQQKLHPNSTTSL